MQKLQTVADKKEHFLKHCDCLWRGQIWTQSFKTDTNYTTFYWFEKMSC